MYTIIISNGEYSLEIHQSDYKIAHTVKKAYRLLGFDAILKNPRRK